MSLTFEPAVRHEPTVRPTSFDRARPQPADSSRALSAGKPIDNRLRAVMEDRLGHDFGRVRVHTDAAAAASAHAVGALAYTRGNHIVFGASQYAPATRRGQELLVHELAHVVQHDRAPATSAGRDDSTGEAEREAAAVSDSVMAGERRTPRARPGGPVQRQRDATAGAPAPTWQQQVDAAAGETDQTKKLGAMVQLVRQAVGPTMTVHPVPLGKTLDPAQLKPSPVINFDLNLNQKQSWPATAGAKTRLLSKNAGYSFNKGAAMFAVLGPKALDARSPLYTEMTAKHELFHVSHHLGAGAKGRSDADEELEAWTNDFTTYFERLVPFRQQWAPLIGYYEDATAPARQVALAAILAFYQGAAKDTPAAFDRWLKRRQGDTAQGAMLLVKDLAAKLVPTEGSGSPRRP